MSARDLDLAREDGRIAGELELAAGLNPYLVGTPEAAIWQSERLSAIARRHPHKLRQECEREQARAVRVTAADLDRAFKR